MFNKNCIFDLLSNFLDKRVKEAETVFLNSPWQKKDSGARNVSISSSFRFILKPLTFLKRILWEMDITASCLRTLPAPISMLQWVFALQSCVRGGLANHLIQRRLLFYVSHGVAWALIPASKNGFSSITEKKHNTSSILQFTKQKKKKKNLFKSYLLFILWWYFIHNRIKRLQWWTTHFSSTWTISIILLICITSQRTRKITWWCNSITK